MRAPDTTGRKEGGLRTRGGRKETASDRPLVTVVTVVFNGEAHLEQSVRSVIGQSYGHVEYLVVDGASTDGTLDIIKKYDDRIDYWISERDSGIYEAMNKGIGLAGGELIALLNADDFYAPDAVATIVKTYLAHDRRPAIYYGHHYVLQEDMGICYRAHATLDFWRGMSVSHQAMFIHRDVYARLGGYSLEYRVVADYDFVLRALGDQIPLVGVDGFLVHYRNSGISARHPLASLGEGRKVSRRHFSLLSLAHLRYNLLFLKSMLLVVLEKIIGLCFGTGILMRLKQFYFKKFISRGNEF